MFGQLTTSRKGCSNCCKRTTMSQIGELFECQVSNGFKGFSRGRYKSLARAIPHAKRDCSHEIATLRLAKNWTSLRTGYEAAYLDSWMARKL